RTGFFEGGVEIGARGLYGGDESKEDAGEDGNQRSKGQDTPVQRDTRAIDADAGDVAGVQRQQAADAEQAEEEAKRAADHGEQHAFGKELLDDAAAAGADGGADGDFARADGGAGQQKVGDVGAGNEEHATHRAQQNHERGADVAHQDLL